MTGLFKHPITKIIVSSLLCFVIPVLGKEFLIKPVLEILLLPEHIAKVMQNILTMMTLLGTYLTVFKYYELRSLPEISFEHFPRDFINGLSLGVGLIILIYISLFMLGYFEILGYHFAMGHLIAFTSLAVMALFEEIIFRGIIYRIIEKWAGTYIALILPSILFGVVHFTSPHMSLLGIVGATIGGLVLGSMYSLTKQLWLPFSFHLGWNYAQHLFGKDFPGVLEMDTFIQGGLEGSNLWTGSQFGIEDSVLAILLTIVLFCILLKNLINRNLIIKPSWKINSDTIVDRKLML